IFCTPINTATMIFRTMDAIPRSFSPADRNPIECLLLPIAAIIESTTDYKLSTKLKSATVGDIYELQATGFFLTPIPTNRLPRSLKVVARKLHTALNRATCHLHPFFRACLERTSLSLYSQDDRPQIQALLNFASFRRGLQIQQSDPDFAANKGRTRSFRQMIMETTERRVLSTQGITTSSWNAFWALLLNATQR
ncbi:hypothetical protein, partial, partial [Parasitella parasitica]